MSLMVSVELESSLGGCVGVVVDCEVPELLGGVEVLDEAVPEVEGVVEGGVCAVLGAEDCVLGAAGGVEAVYSVLAIRDQIAPPTINLVNQDFDAGCDLDYCANTARKLEINAVASNSFGFGGTNGTLVFKRFKD